MEGGVYVVGLFAIILLIVLWNLFTKPLLREFNEEPHEYLYGQIFAPILDLAYITFLLLNTKKKVPFEISIQWIFALCIILVPAYGIVNE